MPISVRTVPLIDSLNSLKNSKLSHKNKIMNVILKNASLVTGDVATFITGVKRKKKNMKIKDSRYTE